jgi:hypothetical protein
MLVVAVVAFVVVERYWPEKALSESEAVSQPGLPEESSESVPADVPVPLPVNKKSIAVLPFANRSNQGDDLFFTDGIHDDL